MAFNGNLKETHVYFVWYSMGKVSAYKSLTTWILLSYSIVVIYIAASLQKTKTNGKNTFNCNSNCLNVLNAQRSSLDLQRQLCMRQCGYTATNLSTTLSKSNERAPAECIDKTATSDNLSSSIVVLKYVFINLRQLNERSDWTLNSFNCNIACNYSYSLCSS